MSSFATGPVRGQARAGTTTVVVTMTAFKLELAPPTVPVGSVVFKVVNRGKIRRDFKIGGKKTPRIATGKSATLKVEFAKKGTYSYFSAGPDRAARLSGVLVVGEPCTHPAASTVSAKLTGAPIGLSQATVPCGTVTFVVTNVGRVVHSFHITVPDSTVDAPGGQGPPLNPGQTVRLTVHFTVKGIAIYYCGEPEHDELYDESGYLSVI